MTARLADLPEVLSVDQVASYLGISRNSAYVAVKRREIRSVSVGRRVLVTRSALTEFLGLSLAQGPANLPAGPHEHGAER